ncbi:leucyl aminopeptidase [Afifella marina DSM 2698]|uniref:Leucyl aminopeptidase n=2 Tax=Afifella marina TaxID=1080 RepID=A0A1G5NAQ1_AFIMA|nr:leucyl aminopeptidase [Afifella marina DSM 2698]
MSNHPVFVRAGEVGAEMGVTPVTVIEEAGLDEALAGLSDQHRKFADVSGFCAHSGDIALLPGADGGLERVLFGAGRGGLGRNPFLTGKLAQKLPDGHYRLEGALGELRLAALGFALGGYRFTRYHGEANVERPCLVLPDDFDIEALRRTAESVSLTRDLINTPANDFGPAELASAARQLAEETGADFTLTEGEELARNYPLIHAVGHGSDRAPCLIDMRWGDEADPKLTLVGKGVVFDTGGLDIKPPSSMLLMKKDMGGAANVLGLARMIMLAGLKVRLRVLIPAVENSISGRAFRPGDVFPSRKGLTVEIGNTDAEGRLVLADALALADEEKPELIVSMATLTGAARVAVGPDIAPFFTDDEAVVGGVQAAAETEHDPVWRLPLWKPYDAWLSSEIADVNHISSNSFAGATTAALFLSRFVTESPAYLHFDIFGWAPKARALGPKGGEAQGIRALFAYCAERYGRG